MNLERYGYYQRKSTKNVGGSRITTKHHQIVVPISISGVQSRLFAHERFTNNEKPRLFEDSHRFTTIEQALVVHDPYILSTCQKAFEHHQKKFNTKIKKPIFVTLSHRNYTQTLNKKRTYFLIYMGIINTITLLTVLFLLYPRESSTTDKEQEDEQS